MQVLLDTLELSGAIKKTPVVVGNCTGFAVNRVFFPYTMAACLLMDSGVNPYQVDIHTWASAAVVTLL
jgi:enoyl-CoA hydratase/3-hydroxyacyl-CoA dehydrogenase